MESEIYKQISGVYNNIIAKSIFFIMMSYNTIVTITDFFFQYQLSILCVTTAALTTATSSIMMWGAIISFLISISAPYINQKISPQTQGLIAPISLMILTVVFFSLILFPTQCALLLAMLGLHNVNILLLSCIIGATIDTLQKSFRYSIMDVFNLKVWNKVDESKRSDLTATTNMYSNRPIKGLVSGIVLLLIAISINQSLISTAWIMPIIIGLAFWAWISSVKRVSNGLQQNIVEKSVPMVDMLKNEKLWIMMGICLMLIFGITFLSVLKTSLVIGAAGPESLIWLKALIIPVIFSAHWLVNKVKEKYKKNTFYALVILANIFFIIFAVLFPYGNLMHAMLFSLASLPAGLGGVFNFWLFSTFFIFAEIWTVVALDVLYYPLQNSVFKKEELNTSIPIIAAACCISQLIASALTSAMGSLGLSTGSMLWLLAGAFLLTTVVSLVCYRVAEKKGIIITGDKNQENSESLKGTNLEKVDSNVGLKHEISPHLQAVQP